MIVDDGNLNQARNIRHTSNNHEGYFHEDLHNQEDGPEAEMAEDDPDGEAHGVGEESSMESKVEKDVEIGSHHFSAGWLGINILATNPEKRMIPNTVHQNGGEEEQLHL